MAGSPLALIIGAGSGVSASLARLLHRNGYDIALAARNTDKLMGLAEETHASAWPCDVTSRESIENLFGSLDATPDIMIYNPSYRVRGPLADLDPDEVQRTLQTTAFGAFLAARQAVPGMLERGSGTIIFTGASAGVKGYPQSAPFAMGKFALRGLAQSMARELHPQNIHVGHVVIDGGIRSERRPDEPGADKLLDPDAIAESYLHLIRQPRSSWSWEIEVRPWVEKF
ncbi:MAG: SDR family NAD(P)-dependent oxidoreductase [Hyphomicrobiales bacterium]|nr:SDR family NAD(P)-dependent oxidoreductase [Hyphomicrobiales bacterium]